MRPSTVRHCWKLNRPALCPAVALSDPLVTELVSLLGFDCIWLDFEHSPRGLDTAAHLMRGARVGVSDILARPARGEFMQIGRLLEAGATGIMYPRCQSPDEAAQVVASMKFHPVGQRGFDGGGVDAGFAATDMPTYIAHANRETFLLVQIEDPVALEMCEKIAAVPGVDGLFFGPGDFSVLASVPGQMAHPLINDATRRIAAAARSAGKVWGMPGFDPAHVARVLDQGARFIAYGTDHMFIKEGLEAVQKQFAPLGFAFQNRLSAGVRPL